MAESQLWLVNHSGTVFSLPISKRHYSQLQSTHDDSVSVSVKRLASAHWCAWAVGHDHRTYLYVFSTDVPIRIPDTTYENQRWSLIHDYSKRGLIRTDRPAWSDESGRQERPKESVRLPSAHWIWDSDWFIDDNLRGEVVNLGGWQYAVDFPSLYTPEQHWNSFVRRRKWTRFRCYAGTDTWARISDMEVVENSECFIDISVGCSMLPSQPKGFLSVWAVVNNGKVYVRTNVHHENPEGSAWKVIDVENSQGVINISVGATNLIWAITWDGHALVRTHVSRDNIYGLGWKTVEFPNESTRLMQVAVGRNAVWAISRDEKVWFRKGTWGDNQFWSCDSAVGSSWIEMVGEMSHITVSAKDQVFAIDASDRFVYFRTGVSHHDLTGKTWQRVTLREDLSYFYDLGLMADGLVCSCGGLDSSDTCEIHGLSRDRNLSTSTSCSNLSINTSVSSSVPRETEEVDGSTDVLMIPLQPSRPKLKSFHSFHADNLPPAWTTTRRTPEDGQMSETLTSSMYEQVFGESKSSVIIEPLLYNDSHFASSPSPSDKPDISDSKIQAPDFTPVTFETNSQKVTCAPSLDSAMSKSASTLFPESSSGIVNHKHSVTHIETEDDGHVQACFNVDKPKTSDSLVEKELRKESGILDRSSSADINEVKMKQHLCESHSNFQTQLQNSVTQCTSEQTLESVCVGSDEINTSEINVKDGRVDKESIRYKSVKVIKTSEDSVSYLNSSSDLTEVDRDFNFLGASFSLNTEQHEREAYKSDHQTVAVDNSVQCLQESSQLKANCDSKFQHAISHNIPGQIEREQLCLPQSHDKLLHSEADEKVLQTVLVINHNKSDNNSENAAMAFVDQSVTIHSATVNYQKTRSDTFDNEAVSQPEGRRLSKSHRRKSGTKSSGSLGAVNDDSIVFKPRKKKDKIRKIKAEGRASGDCDVFMSSPMSQQASEEDHPHQSPDGNSGVSTKDNRDQPWKVEDMIFNEAKPDNDVITSKKSEPITVNITNPSNSSDMQRPEVYDSVSGCLHVRNNKECERGEKDESKSENVNVDNVSVLKSRGIVDTDAATNTMETNGDKLSDKVIKKEETEEQFIASSMVLDDYHSEMKQCGNQNVTSTGSENVQTLLDSLETHKAVKSEREDDHHKELNHSEVEDEIDVGINLSENDNELLIDTNADSLMEGLQSDITAQHTGSGSLHREAVEHRKVKLNMRDNYPRWTKNQNQDTTSETENASERPGRVEREGESLMISPGAEHAVVAISPEKVVRTEALKLTQSSDTSVPMTKLRPSVKKVNGKGVGSEFDDIVDFVTDLQSDEDDTGELRQSEEDEDQGVVNEETVQALVSDLIDYHQTRTDTPGQSMEGNIVSGKISSCSSGASLSSSVTGVTGNPFHNPPSAFNSIEFRRASFVRQTPSPAGKSFPSKIDLGNVNEDIVPSQELMAAQPRQSWKWLDASSCLFDDPGKIDWLSLVEPDDEPETSKCKISKAMRDKFLEQIKARNQRVITRFASVQTAIERSTWVRKANMQVYHHGRYNRWCSCTAELEQGIQDREQGTLTVHYSRKRSQENKHLNLIDVICVKMSSDPDLPTTFTIYTAQTNLAHKPLMLKASSEMEASEWVGHLSYARAAAWNLNSPISPGAVWACSFIGDVLVSPPSQSTVKPFERCWGQHGGHMAVVETSPCGVTWGLGFDKQAYIYNGGFGGAVCTGQNDMSSNLEQFSDKHHIFVYENQKWFPLVGWCNKGVFKRDFHWVTSSGQFVKSRDEVKLPSSKWHWTSEWTIDFSIAGGVDKSGWQYSVHFDGPYHQGSHIRDHYRRRRWFRRCQINLIAPWTIVGMLPISDVSLQIDPVNSSTDLVVMWAVGANGDVLCRDGVTQSNPMGLSWVHVTTHLDKPFISISVGGRGRVWGVAADGSAWYRTGVTQENPAGKFWSQVVPPPPGNFQLRQVSVGEMAVWAVDTGDNLWKRENVTESYPEGTLWISMGSKVKRVSVGCQDQVWIVADSYFQKSKHGPGVVYHRTGITEKCPGGTDWESVIGSGWAHVSVRGLQEAQFIQS